MPPCYRSTSTISKASTTSFHSIGDIVLRHGAGLLGDAGREGSLAIRMGGEEFLLLPQPRSSGRS
ncbi:MULTISPECIES: diguanylate cyclase domain-containing protein [Rhizobium]|uniref:diguanylate cyclase domain-containing protein n=1 Tax=Rhizobium TaxID=379 RepID=UPI001FDF5425|nr:MULTISPECIES: diguanylate cyclase [Rhizobium]